METEVAAGKTNRSGWMRQARKAELPVAGVRER